MGNASKALLIAAAVLIAIILIAVEVRLLNAAGDTSDDAQKIGDDLGGKVGDVSDKVVSYLNGIPKTTVKNVFKNLYESGYFSTSSKNVDLSKLELLKETVSAVRYTYYQNYDYYRDVDKENFNLEYLKSLIGEDKYITVLTLSGDHSVYIVIDDKPES